MIGTLPNHPDFSKALGQHPETAVTRHEVVSGFLIAAIGLTGLITTILGLLFFLNMEWDKKPRVPMFVVEPFSRSEAVKGVADEIEEPGVTELAETEDPQLADALEMVTNAVSKVRANLEKIDGNADKPGKGASLGNRKRTGTGGPDNGPETDASKAIEKWVVKYSTTSKDTYAEQLDFFEIEVGSLSKTTQLIEYATDLSKKKPTYRKGVRKDEKRVYFKKPNNHPVVRWDKALLESAGAETLDRYIFTFYPNETIKALYTLEQTALKRDEKELDDVKQTVFTVEPKEGGGFEYKLNQIKYH